MFKRKKTEVWQSRLGTSAFNPLEVLDMQDAVKKRAKFVTIGGTKFTLSYKHSGKVFYKPVNAFAPSGYLDIEQFLRGL